MPLELTELGYRVTKSMYEKQQYKKFSDREVARVREAFQRTPCERVLFELAPDGKGFWVHHGPADRREVHKVTQYTPHWARPKALKQESLPVSWWQSICDTADPKAKNLAIKEYLRMPIHTFRTLWRAFSYKAFVEQNEDLVKEYCFLGRAKEVSPWAINKLNSGVAEIIRQNRKDGIDNISPLCFAWEKTPKELKELLGKGIWKKLCKNTKHRNKVIATKFRNYNFKFESNISHLKRTIDLPTTLLQRGWFKAGNILDFWWWEKVLKGNIPISHVSKAQRGEDYVGKLNVLRDVRSMHMQLFAVRGTILDGYAQAQEYLSPLSYRRFEELHEEYTKEITLRKLAKIENAQKTMDVFENSRRNTLYETSLEVEGVLWTATLLTSPAQIIEEGQMQGHCVGSYSDSVEDGTYLVYSIRKDGERYSTLGLNVMPYWRGTVGIDGTREVIQNVVMPCTVTTQQHYVKYNQPLKHSGPILLEKRIEDWYASLNSATETKHATN